MKRILVVDDDQDSCELLREIFSAEGWKVDTALSPTQAFSVAEKEKIDLECGGLAPLCHRNARSRPKRRRPPHSKIVK